MLLAIKNSSPTLLNYIHENLPLDGSEEKFSEEHAYIIKNNLDNWQLGNVHEALLLLLLIILRSELPVED